MAQWGPNERSHVIYTPDKNSISESSRSWYERYLNPKSSGYFALPECDCEICTKDREDKKKAAKEAEKIDPSIQHNFAANPQEPYISVYRNWGGNISLTVGRETVELSPDTARLIGRTLKALAKASTE